MIGTEGIAVRLDALKEDVNEIKEHVKYTNGKIASLIAWRSWMTGGMAMLGLLAVPVILFVVKSWMDRSVINDQVKTAVEQALNNREVIITQ